MASADSLIIAYKVIDAIAAALDARYVSLALQSEESSPRVPRRAGPVRLLFPTGPFAAGIWQPGDDIDLVLVTDNSARTFWDFVCERLELDCLPLSVTTNQFLELTKHSNALSIPELHVLKHWRTKLRLRYIGKPPSMNVSAYGDFASLLYDDKERRASTEGRNLERLAETAAVLKSLRQHSDVESFAQTNARLRQWAESCAIWSTQLGLLNAECLMYLQLWAASHSESVTAHSADDTLIPFSQAFHGLDFGRIIIKASGNTNSADQKHGKPMFVSTDRGRNVASHVTIDGARLIQEAIMAIAVNPCEHCIHDVFREEVAKHLEFILVDGCYWSPHTSAATNWLRHMTFLEAVENAVSSIPSLVRDSGREEEKRERCVRTWPLPIAVLPPLDTVTTKPSARFSYILFPSRLGTDRDVRFGSIGWSLREKLAEFESSLHYDHSNSDIRVSMFDRFDVDDEGMRLIDGLGFRDLAPFELEVPSPTLTYDSPAPDKPIVEPSGRFRTTDEVLNRLRWDPSHSADDYEVGWQDRFDGLKWTNLLEWSNETQDEDFVPQHRVRKIKRKTDDLLVWDRMARLDRT